MAGCLQRRNQDMLGQPDPPMSRLTFNCGNGPWMNFQKKNEFGPSEIVINNNNQDIKNDQYIVDNESKIYLENGKLLSNINRNVYKLHEKGQLALSEQSLPARFTARLALGAERASANSVEFDM